MTRTQKKWGYKMCAKLRTSLSQAHAEPLKGTIFGIRRCVTFIKLPARSQFTG
jgi:hypothetical protein